jgi:hypothetical protein
MFNDYSAIGIFANHQDAENAVKELQRAGFDMKKLSIIGKDYETEEHAVGYYNTGDRMRYWGKMGAFWGAVWGWFIGAAVFLIPGIGPVLVAGPLVAILISTLEGAVVVGGVSALGAALYSLGIPKDTVLRYELALKAEKYLLVVHGTESDVENARRILHISGADDVSTHAPAEEPVTAV